MDGLIQTIPLLLIFGVFYVLVIRPQQQEQAAHDKLIAGLATTRIGLRTAILVAMKRMIWWTRARACTAMSSA